MGLRMPTYFGAAPGPRSGSNVNCLLDERNIVKFKLNLIIKENDIYNVIPNGLKLMNNVLSMSIFFMYDIRWLQNKGYNMITITVPVKFEGKDGFLISNFLICCWENHCDPILTGREELGWCKLYAEIYSDVRKDHIYLTAICESFKFIEIQAYGFQTSTSSCCNAQAEGIINLKYFPKTGSYTDYDAKYYTFTPQTCFKTNTIQQRIGLCHVKCLAPSQLHTPTQHHIISFLSKIINEHENVKIEMHNCKGGGNLSETRIVV